jgi:hypothetical protein
MTDEIARGAVVLVVVVAAAIAWLALRPAPRHDGVTRAQEEAFLMRTPRTGDGQFFRRVRCGPERGHWQCRGVLVSGRTLAFDTRPRRPAAIAFFTSR